MILNMSFYALQNIKISLRLFLMLNSLLGLGWKLEKNYVYQIELILLNQLWREIPKNYSIESSDDSIWYVCMVVLKCIEWQLSLKNKMILHMHVQYSVTLSFMTISCIGAKRCTARTILVRVTATLSSTNINSIIPSTVFPIPWSTFSNRCKVVWVNKSLKIIKIKRILVGLYYLNICLQVRSTSGLTQINTYLLPKFAGLQREWHCM